MTRRSDQHAGQIGIAMRNASMRRTPTLVIVFLTLLALLQLTRVLLGWDVVVNGVSVPLWASGIASVIAGGLALLLWRDAHR